MRNSERYFAGAVTTVDVLFATFNTSLACLSYS